MEREIIEVRVHELPVSELGIIPNDEEIWEENDGGAHFKVTRLCSQKTAHGPMGP